MAASELEHKGSTSNNLGEAEELVLPENQEYILRTHPDGSPMIKAIVDPGIKHPEHQSPAFAQLRFYDSKGEQLETPFLIVGGIFDGTRYTVLEQSSDGVPIRVRYEQVAKHYGEHMVDTLVKAYQNNTSDTEPGLESQPNSQTPLPLPTGLPTIHEQYFEFDDEGRPAKVTTFAVLPFTQDSLFAATPENTEYLEPVSELLFSFDKEGRQRLIANVIYTSEQQPIVTTARLTTHTDEISGDMRSRFIYKQGEHSSDRHGAVLSKAYLWFERYRKTKDTEFEESSLFYRPQSKAEYDEDLPELLMLLKNLNPDGTITLYPPSPKRVMPRPQEFPETVTVATFLTAENLQALLERDDWTNDDIKQNGTSLKEQFDPEIEAYCYQEILQYIRYSGEKLAIKLAAQIIAGKVRAPSSDEFSYDWDKRKTKPDNIIAVLAFLNSKKRSYEQKVAWFALELVPLLQIAQRSAYTAQSEAIIAHLLEIKFTSYGKFGITAQELRSFAVQYRETHETIPEDIQLLLEILEDPKGIFQFYIEQPERFANLL